MARGHEAAARGEDGARGAAKRVRRLWRPPPKRRHPLMRRRLKTAAGVRPKWRRNGGDQRLCYTFHEKRVQMRGGGGGLGGVKREFAGRRAERGRGGEKGGKRLDAPLRAWGAGASPRSHAARRVRGQWPCRVRRGGGGGGDSRRRRARPQCAADRCFLEWRGAGRRRRRRTKERGGRMKMGGRGHCGDRHFLWFCVRAAEREAKTRGPVCA